MEADTAVKAQSRCRCELPSGASKLLVRETCANIRHDMKEVQPLHLSKLDVVAVSGLVEESAENLNVSCFEFEGGVFFRDGVVDRQVSEWECLLILHSRASGLDLGLGLCYAHYGIPGYSRVTAVREPNLLVREINIVCEDLRSYGLLSSQSGVR